MVSTIAKQAKPTSFVVNITNGTSIGSDAFSGCTGLTSITIPSSITSIDSNAFSGCTGLTGCYITDLARWYTINFETKATNPLYYAKKLYVNGELVTELVIPDNMTTIPNYTFINCTDLTNITIPDSVTRIGESTSEGCVG